MFIHSDPVWKRCFQSESQQLDLLVGFHAAEKYLLLYSRHSRSLLWNFFWRLYNMVKFLILPLNHPMLHYWVKPVSGEKRRTVVLLTKYVKHKLISKILLKTKSSKHQVTSISQYFNMLITILIENYIYKLQNKTNSGEDYKKSCLRSVAVKIKIII